MPDASWGPSETIAWASVIVNEPYYMPTQATVIPVKAASTKRNMPF